MRLSTARDRDETRAVGVLHAALDAGVTLLDTADAYCLDAADTGHNERLIARALSTWTRRRSRVQRRDQGRPDPARRPLGARRPRAGADRGLRSEPARARASTGFRFTSCTRPTRASPLATSVRALDALKRRGLVEAIGLCNVTVGQIEEARRITEIAVGAGRAEPLA